MGRMEVITTTDKVKRDEMFQDLRKNGDAFERQVVKFSGNEPVFFEGEPESTAIQYSSYGRVQWRPKYVSNWSIAYPTDPGQTNRVRLFPR